MAVKTHDHQILKIDMCHVRRIRRSRMKKKSYRKREIKRIRRIGMKWSRGRRKWLFFVALEFDWIIYLSKFIHIASRLDNIE